MSLTIEVYPYIIVICSRFVNSTLNVNGLKFCQLEFFGCPKGQEMKGNTEYTGLKKEDLLLKSGKSLPFSKRTLVMAILNVTPDSFSDGGVYFNQECALEQAKKIIAQRADILDIGGESSRPGALPVSIDEELSRVIPVIKEIRNYSDIPISVDTVKHEVAQSALDAGADIINDISAFSYDSSMAEVVAEKQVPVVLMHSKGSPETMQNNPEYEEVVSEIISFLENAVIRAEKAGILKKNIIIDPGIGFGKTVEHNLSIINRLENFHCLNLPVLVGLSRKSFIGEISGESVDCRLEGTIAANAVAIVKGASIIRVHDVAEGIKTARLADCIKRESIC